jgi:hypothetical protein
MNFIVGIIKALLYLVLGIIGMAILIIAVPIGVLMVVGIVLYYILGGPAKDRAKLESRGSNVQVR